MALMMHQRSMTRVGGVSVRVSPKVFAPVAPVARRVVPVAPAAPAARRVARGVVCRATDPIKGENILGMPTESGFTGFTPFAETWTGRWAMLGIVSSICVEFATGKPTLQQIGLMTPNPTILVAMVAIFGTATVLGSVGTTQKLLGNKMSRTDMNRYRSFLGLDKEEDSDKTAMAMKGKTAPPMMPLDGPEGANPEMMQEQQAAQAERRSNEGAYGLSGNAEARFANDIEMNNGRLAMLGFLAAVLVEAATGQGIIGQCIGYAKAVGLLGPMSGF